MDAFDTLLSRASISKLGRPIPDDATLDRILATAMRAPDHGRLRPWRFLVISGDGLARLADAGAASRARRAPAPDEGELEKIREKLTRAPMAIVLGGKIVAGHKIPEIEQELAVGAAAMNLLNALHAAGFAGKWVTGAHTYDPDFARALGFAEDERLYGMIMAGTARAEETPERADARAVTRHWR